MTDDETNDTDHFASALSAAGRFVYRNSDRLALVSLVWFVSSVPIVTSGVATLGAYVAVAQLRSDRNRVEWEPLVALVRNRAVAATLFGLFPLSLYALSALYAVSAGNSRLRTLLFFGILYGAVYATLVMIPTFDALAAGRPPRSALTAGGRWTAAHPTLSLLSLLISLGIFGVTLLLTVAFPLLFAGLVVSVNIHLVRTDDWTVTDGSEPFHPFEGQY